MLAAFGGATEAQMQVQAEPDSAQTTKTTGQSYGATEAEASGSSRQVSALQGAVEDLESATATQPLLPPRTDQPSSGSLAKLHRIFTSPAVWAVLGWDFFYVSWHYSTSRTPMRMAS